MQSDSDPGEPISLPRKKGRITHQPLWPTAAFIGWLLLPAGPIFLINSSTSIAWDNAMIGMTVAGSWMHWTLLFVSVAIMQASFRNRILVLVCGGTVLTLIWLSNALLEDTFNVAAFTLLSPFVAVLIALPVLITSMFRGWRIVHLSDTSPVRPTSITSYLLLTAFIAVLIAALRLVPDELKDDWSDEPQRLSTLLATPVIASIGAVVFQIRVLLGFKSLRTRSTAIWFSVATAVTFAITLVGPCAITVWEDFDEVWMGFFFAAAWWLAFFGGSATFIVFLRQRGYRLRQRDGTV
ncbi:MAG: hypothetical protein AAFX06_06980 [Planctomycetota bacterium]